MSSITAGNSVSQSELSLPTIARSGTQVFDHRHLFERHVHGRRIAQILVNGIRPGAAISKSCSMRNHLNNVELCLRMAFA